MLITPSEDSILNREKRLALRVVSEYYDFSSTKSVEILCSYENNDFAKILMELLVKSGVRNIFITYTNGIMCEEINNGYRKYLDDRISFYKERISEEFIRITILSPFPLPVVITDEISEYQKHLGELSFLNDYLIESPRIMIVKPNQLWARKLGLTLEELWDKVDSFYDSLDSYDSIKEKLNNYQINKIHFKSDEGTDCIFELTPNFKWIGKKISWNGHTFQANAPSLEIFTAPKKFSGEGKIVFTKPLCYHGKIINDMEIQLHNGKVIDNKNLDSIISLDSNLSYIGEVALCPYKEGFYYSTILDENSGCHIALGNAYPYGIENKNLINQCPYHIDLVFGSDSLAVDGIKEDGSVIPIMRDGKLCTL